MDLRGLAASLPVLRLEKADCVDITSIAYDSRRVVPGSLFVAVPGQKSDGHSYIPQAVESGAAAVAVQADHSDRWLPYLSEHNVASLTVADTRRALSSLAAAFYGHPARRMRVIGVTGTDGKTTTAWLISAVLEAAGYRTGLISTVSGKAGERSVPNDYAFTTPEAPEVQRMLSEMVKAGAHYAVVEATSHGLALNRLGDCEFDAAVFTNVGVDHQDFHGSQEEYLRAKGRLFEMLDGAALKPAIRGSFGGGPPAGEGQWAPPKIAVLNADDPAAGYFRGLTRAQAISYGVESEANLRALEVALSLEGSRFLMRWTGGVEGPDALPAQGENVVDLRLPGLFNVYNALAAAALGLSQGVPLDKVVEGLSGFAGVPGRMEYISEGQSFTVVVDFAHAPGALRQALGFLRAHTKSRLIAVFGCLGERDEQRRFAMGRVAGELADYSLITNDNPLSEDPEAIMAEIAHGLEAAGRISGEGYALVPDRRQAIASAFAMAQPGDAVLLAGKGHETSITIGRTVIPWDERRVARELLTEGTAKRGLRPPRPAQKDI